MRRQSSYPLKVSTRRSSAFCFPISPRIGNRHASCIIEDPWRFRGTIYFERLRGTRKEKLATGPVTARHESRLVAIVRKSGRKIECRHHLSRGRGTLVIQKQICRCRCITKRGHGVVRRKEGKHIQGSLRPAHRVADPALIGVCSPAFFSNSSHPKSVFRRRTNIINWDCSSDTVVKFCLYKSTLHYPCT